MELHQDQQFNDSNDVYVWVFDPTPFHKQLIGALIGELSLLQLSVYFSEYFHIHMEYEKIAKILKAKEKKIDFNGISMKVVIVRKLAMLW